MPERKEEKGRNTSKVTTKIDIDPAEVAAVISSNKEKESNANTSVVIVNGRKLEPEALKSFVFQWSDNMLLVEIDYELPKDTSEVKSKKVNTDEGPSTKGISISEPEGPEVFPLEEEGLLKLEAISALRTNKENDNISVSKLKTVLPKKTKYETEEVILATDKLNITEVASMTSALNDLAVKEQKIQKDRKVVKVEEVACPKIVILKDIFYLTEKLKLYKVKE